MKLNLNLIKPLHLMINKNTQDIEKHINMLNLESLPWEIPWDKNSSFFNKLKLQNKSVSRTLRLKRNLKDLVWILI